MADDPTKSPADDTAPMTPPWWLKKLQKQLQDQAAGVARFERYYDGEHDLKFVSEKYRHEFGRILREISDNWMELVVEAVNERLHVDGFRVRDTKPPAAGRTTRLSKPPEIDLDAWAIWQANHLDADSETVHRTAITTGVAYVMVWPDPKDASKPIITPEHPSQVTVSYEPGSHRQIRSALKWWTDDWGAHQFANLYLPNAIYKWAAPYNSSGGNTRPKWVPIGELVTGAEAELRNPFGVVPIVPFVNVPDIYGTGRSELRNVTSTQDQINKLVCDMLVASEFAAYRQRWAAGIEPEIDETTGQKKQPFESGPGKVWIDPNPDSKFGEFGATDLANYVKSIENRVQSIASRTRTPPHYLLGQSGSFPSGESLKSTETGLVAKGESKTRHFGESWEDTMRLSGKIAGVDRLATAEGAEVIWRDLESRTEAEHVDALTKLRAALGVPLRVLWERAGFTQQEIGDFRAMLAEEAIYASLAQPPVAPPAPEPGIEPEPATA